MYYYYYYFFFFKFLLGLSWEMPTYPQEQRASGKKAAGFSEDRSSVLFPRVQGHVYYAHIKLIYDRGGLREKVGAVE